MNSLRGVFPEPDFGAATISKRNFIKENMMQIKRMQGLTDINERNATAKKNRRKRLDPDSGQKTIKLIQNTRKQMQGLKKLTDPEKPKIAASTSTKNIPAKNVNKNRGEVHKTAVEAYNERRKCKEIGIQTENFTNVKQIYDSGTVKYPSNEVITILASNRSKSPRGMIGEGDKSRPNPSTPGKYATDAPVEKGDNKKRDYVKENAQVMKNSSTKSNMMKDPTVAPPAYQKGVVPKYIRERKEELYRKTQTAEGDEKCPEGHVVLPENERKETLRMLRQSYAELITELNMLPVRSDTLKIRNRKIEIENQLKKLDEGIKVFTRPKVYVKIGA